MWRNPDDMNALMQASGPPCSSHACPDMTSRTDSLHTTRASRLRQPEG